METQMKQLLFVVMLCAISSTLWAQGGLYRAGGGGYTLPADSNLTYIKYLDGLKAPIASPTFTGTGMMNGKFGVGSVVVPQHSLVVVGTDATTGLNIVRSDINITRTTAAQATDTASICLKFTGTGKPLMTVMSATGATLFNLDSNGVVTIAKGYVSSSVAIADSNIDCTTGQTFTKTLGANQRFNVNNMVDGQQIEVDVLNTASNYTVTWVTAITWQNGVTPIQTTGAKTDFYSLWKRGTTIYGTVTQNY
jgi:hypothetical protein